MREAEVREEVEACLLVSTPFLVLVGGALPGGGARARRPCRLLSREQSLVSEATLAASESRSSQEPALLEPRRGPSAP